MLLLIGACGSSYKHLAKTNGDIGCVQKFQPVISTALYNTNVNVIGNHLSGILIIKRMADSSLRMVFSNEAGFKFFDFEFAADGSFKVHAIIDKMNKKAVIKTLRKDFELVLLQNLDKSQSRVLSGDSVTYYDFGRGKDHYYYVTDTACKELLWMERGSKRKKILRAISQSMSSGIPDTIGITHNNFNFDIGLRRITYAE